MAKKKDQKVYMPLMIGDWLKGTSGMRAEVKGVYINLLLHQWDNGFIPEDIEELSLIAPEIRKVWDTLKVKFPKTEKGKLQNSKLEEVRDFWKKQRGNGKKGGRPKKDNPEANPNNNPTTNPKHNLHNEHDLDNDSSSNKLKSVAEKILIEKCLTDAFDDIMLESIKSTFPKLDVPNELKIFSLKVRGSPNEYARHEAEGLRRAFIYQLKNSTSTNGNGTNNSRGAAKGTTRRADAIIEEGKDFGTL